MNLLFISIGAIILLYSLVNYKKGFIFYLVYKLFLVTNITIISSPSLPLLTMEMFMTLAYIFLFFCHRGKLQNAHTKFPFTIPFVLLSVSWLLSSIFSLAGFNTELSNFVKIVSEETILIWMIWEILETPSDFQKLYNYLTFAFFFTCIYGLIEAVIQTNPIATYESTLLGDDPRAINFLYDTTWRGYRVQSVFEHTIGAGINWSMYSVFTLWLWLNQNNKNELIHVNFLSVITAFLCIPCIILTKQRSPLLFFFLSALSLINFKKKRFYVILLIGIVFLFGLFPLLSANSNIINSFFNQEAAASIGGSNLQQRLGQFAVAFKLIKKNPILGLGNKYATVLPLIAYSGLYGSESIWLQTIVQYGFLGVAAEITLLCFSISVAMKCDSKPILFFVLAYWFTYSFSSFPGMKLYLYYLIIFFFIKNSDFYRKSLMEGRIYGFYFKKMKIHKGCIKRETTCSKV